MAVSIFLQPNQYSISYVRSPVVYRYAGLTSSYSYIFNLYVSTGTTASLTTIYTSTQRKSDTNNGLTVDVSRLLQNYIKNNNFTYTTENVVWFKAALLEYTNDTSLVGTTTSNVGLATLGYTDYPTSTGSFNITEQSTAVDYALNSIPVNTPYYIPTDASYTFVWRYNSTTTYTIVYKNAAESANTTIGPTSFSAKTNARDEAKQIACGYADLSSISLRYPINLTIGSNTYTFYPEPFGKNTTQTLKFLNKWGVWDYFYCVGRKNTEIDINYETYKYMNVNYSSMSYQPLEGLYKKSFIQGKNRIILNTGWLDENKNQKLEEMLMSEYVILNGTTPVIITDKNMKYLTNQYDKMINYTLTLEEAFDTINNVI